MPMTVEQLPKLDKLVTYGESYGAAMQIEDQGVADVYFRRLCEYTRQFCTEAETRKNAERVVRQNLGYYAGYYDNETRVRVERLFQCAHPVFGAVQFSH